MAKYNNSLRNETVSLVKLAKYIYQDLNLKTVALATPEEFKKVKRVVVSGCGDSLCAGYAVGSAFEQLTGLEVDTPTAIDLGRYYHPARFGEPGETLVLLVSVSGGVSRMVECAERAKKYGALTVAVTHTTGSPLANACDRILQIVPDEFDYQNHTPGSRSYLGSVMAMLLLAINMGNVIGKYDMDRAAEYKQELLNYVNEFDGNVLEKMDDDMYYLADLWKDLPFYEYVGGGSDFATAWFGQAKLYEATGDFSRYENYEDWCHVNYFARKQVSGTFIVIEKDSPAFSRAVEMVGIVDRLGHPYCVLTDADPAEFAAPDKVFTMPTCKYGFFKPLLQFAPTCSFAAALADIKKIPMFRGDMRHEGGMFGPNGNVLRTSKIEIV